MLCELVLKLGFGLLVSVMVSDAKLELMLGVGSVVTPLMVSALMPGMVLVLLSLVALVLLSAMVAVLL